MACHQAQGQGVVGDLVEGSGQDFDNIAQIQGRGQAQKDGKGQDAPQDFIYRGERRGRGGIFFFSPDLSARRGHIFHLEVAMIKYRRR